MIRYDKVIQGDGKVVACAANAWSRGCAGGNLYAGTLDIHGKPNGKASKKLTATQTWELNGVGKGGSMRLRFCSHPNCSESKV